MATKRRTLKSSTTSTTATATTNEFAQLVAQIEKDRGEKIILPANVIPPACCIPTGAFTLDFSLLGGIPEGFATMIYGLESSGKTTITLKAVASFQRKHPTKLVVWVDTESMFDPEWAAKLGCDLNRLHVIHPSTGEEAVDLFAAAMEPIEVGMVILDSVPGCVPKAVVDRSAEDQTMAVLARLMGIFCSKILTAWGKERRRGHRVTVVIINQFRSKVGLVFGDPRTLPGGRQINHLPSTKIEIKNNEVMGEDAVGNEVVDLNEHTFKITKAKHGSSIRSGQFQMIVNPDKDEFIAQGEFDDYKTVITFSKKFGLLVGGGGKYRIPIIAPDHFPKHDDIIEFLKADKRKFELLKAYLIAAQRISKGMPALPPDGYLCSSEITVDASKISGDVGLAEESHYEEDDDAA
jgi:recombination protein RecA